VTAARPGTASVHVDCGRVYVDYFVEADLPLKVVFPEYVGLFGWDTVIY
jgi:hypothetical protein